MKLVYEKYLDSFPVRIPEHNLNGFLEIVGELAKKDKCFNYLHESVSMMARDGNIHYVFAKSFFDAFFNSKDRLKARELPAKYLFCKKSFQVTTPDGHPYNYIFNFHGRDEKLFNITINVFLKDIDKNRVVDFHYYRFKCVDGNTCEDIFNEFINDVDTDIDTKDILEEMFNFWVNTILYINSGEPDIRFLKAKKRPDFSNPKKLKSKIKKYKNVNFHDCMLVGYEWKKEHVRVGHPRNQAYGPGLAYRKLIWIKPTTVRR